MPVPNTFGTATSAIPLSDLDDNFAAPITIGNTAVQLGNTVTTLNNMTLANVTISSGNVTITNVGITNANVSGTANISTLVVVGNATVGGNTTITGNITAANANVTTNLVLSNGTANGVAYLNVAKVLTTGSALVFDGTNLGVGSASLSAASGRTDVTINGTSSSIVSLGTGGTRRGYMLHDGTDLTTANEQAAGALRWVTSAGEAMRIATATGGVGAVGIGYTSLTSVGNNGLAVLGNVGIGTSSPSTKLDVVGVVKATGAGPSLISTEGSGQLYAAVQLQATSSGGKNWSLVSNATSSPLGAAGSLSFRDSSAGTTHVTLDASGRLLIGGTTTYDFNGQSNLVVSGTANNSTITIASTSDGYLAFADGTTGTQAYVGRISYFHATNYMDFWTNGTEKMRLDSSGIVTMNAYGAGAATFSAAGVISSVSDETWKIKDGVPVDTDSMLKKLEPGYWYYNEEKAPTFGADRQLGFYAQNVNAAIGPEAAPEPEEGKPWGYYDRSVLAVTVMSLQKALATIETLTARITALEGA